MRTFTDTTGRTWSIAVNTVAIKRVKDLLDVQLLAIVEEKCDLLVRLHDDLILRVNVLYALCKPEADAKNVSDEDFGRAMSGDVLDTALTALLEDLVDFFPRPTQRSALRKMIGKLTSLAEQLTRNAEKKLEAIDVDQLAAKCIASSGSSAESPASTPAS